MQQTPWLAVWMDNKGYKGEFHPLCATEDTQPLTTGKIRVIRQRMEEDFQHYHETLERAKEPKSPQTRLDNYRDNLIGRLIICAQLYAKLVIAEKNGFPGKANLSNL